MLTGLGRGHVAWSLFKRPLNRQALAQFDHAFELAIAYTVVETALKHGHDPRDFLLRAATFALQHPGQALLPWNA